MTGFQYEYLVALRTFRLFMGKRSMEYWGVSSQIVGVSLNHSLHHFNYTPARLFHYTLAHDSYST